MTLGRTLMVQGTASSVGKSLLVAALCRVFAQQGLLVAPFKAQNMSNNAAVCPRGGEIGRAQALQARACGIAPSVDQNPILLKPCSETGAQVVVLGRAVATLGARAYQRLKPGLTAIVAASLERLRRNHDLVMIEGAGSPVEINLRDADLANMRTAELADAPVLLLSDIDRGGVFAQLLGTWHLLRESERQRTFGFAINRFRGDASLLAPGLRFLEGETGRPVLGVLPHIPDLRLPEEDAATLEAGSPTAGAVRIDVVRHGRIANFSDLDALAAESDVALRYVEAPPPELPDALILPGTKSTMADLRGLEASGLADFARRCAEAGSEVVGICGGFQMLGARIRDPEGVEAAAGEEAAGLGLLDAHTEFAPTKVTAGVHAVHLASGLEVEGYEIHTGRTAGAGLPVFRKASAVCDGFDGLASGTGRVWGTYLHGLFDGGPFRRHFVNRLRRRRGLPPVREAAYWDVDAELDRLAAWARGHLDLGQIAQRAGIGT